MDRALLVGINKYPGAALNGCVNDVTDMARFLTAGRGFSSGNVRLLTDTRATTQGILDRLEWLVDGLKPGDRALFHYSGHGAQTATRNQAGEPDGLDDVICPIDFDWTGMHMIRDKDFSRIFQAVPVGVEFVWISDSCHSTDSTRGFSMPRQPQHGSRYMPAPADVQWRIESARQLNQHSMTMKAAAAPLNVALVSGCQSDQTAADAFFMGRPNGALTYFLLNELKKSSTAPLANVVYNVKTALRTAHYAQVPGLEGAAAIMNKPFLVQ